MSKIKESLAQRLILKQLESMMRAKNPDISDEKVKEIKGLVSECFNDPDRVNEIMTEAQKQGVI